MEIISDITIIGGGINGTAIAADAALRNYDVTLIEKKDFAGGTSWTSTKLIHGGLRYLAQGHVALVKKALKERTRLAENAPFFVKPIALHLLGQDNYLKYVINRIGLGIYDHMDLKNPFPKTTTQYLNQTHPNLFKSTLKRSLCFYDAYTDDVRLTLANAKQAEIHGAKLFNYSDIESAELKDKCWHLHFSKDGRHYHLKSNYLINATGPWINEVNQQLHLDPRYPIRLVQGSHLIIDRPLPSEAGYILPTHDGRLVFILPYFQSFTLIGTTEKDADKPSHLLSVSPEEINYLIDIYNRYFHKPISTNNIITCYSGIRPLVDTANNDNPSEVSREYLIETDLENTQSIQIYGGKLTTHRQLAETCINQITQYEENPTSCQTRSKPLPGNDLENITPAKFTESLIQKYSHFPSCQIKRLIETYGTNTALMLEIYLTKNEKPQQLSHNLFDFEIHYAKENEWLENFDDFIWRRTKLGLTLNSEEKDKILQFF